MRNGVYKMRVHRSSNGSRYRISFKKTFLAILGTVYTNCVYTVPLTVVGIEFPLKKTFFRYMRNGVYKMCVHRFSNCSRY